MARYIDADKLKDAFHTDTEHLQSRDEHLFDLIMFEIDEAPTADVEEVKHGEWIDNEIPCSMLSKCSLCGYPCGAYTLNYCPNCGAKMDGGKTE